MKKEKGRKSPYTLKAPGVFLVEDPLNQEAWYALYTKSRHEQVAYDQLVLKGHRAFLPKLERWSRRTDRRKKIQVPMFSGYVFVWTTLAPERYLSLLRTIGVVRAVQFAGMPAPINPEQINSLKILVDSGRAIHPADNLAKGEMARIVDGPFKGVVGRLVGRRSKKRLLVWVETINSGVYVDLPEGSLCKAV
jgi:transcription antitermination factor NusG